MHFVSLFGFRRIAPTINEYGSRGEYLRSIVVIALLSLLLLLINWQLSTMLVFSMFIVKFDGWHFTD
jgi:hypothetical protein